MTVGSIVFGPVPAKVGPVLQTYQVGLGRQALNTHACNCIGAQPGQAKCPCALRREAEMGRKMVEEGVTVNGKRYRLVPE